MRKYIILGLCLLLLAIPTHAKEVINLDQYSSCDKFGFCKTEVDINELTLSKEGKDLLKDVDTDTPYALDTSANIWAFQLYVQDKEKLIVTGRITEDTYWTADFGDVFLDPWWNYTTYSFNPYIYVKEAGSCGTAAGGTNLFGLNITTNTNQTCIMWVDLVDTEAGVTWVAVTNPAGNVIVNTTDLSGTNFSFASCVPLNTSAVYRIVEETPATRTSCSDVSFPYAEPGFSVVGGVYCGSSNPATCTQVAEWFAFEEIGYQINESTNYNNWYTTTLLLNHTASNYTGPNSTALNITGTTNLTGLTVLLYVNGTLSANDTDRAENVTAYPCDWYNITAMIGNASTNETTTYWANLTCGVASAILNYSYAICSDNSTLLEHKAGYSNGSFSYNDTYTLCTNDCDNVTFSCRYPSYVEDAIGFLIVIGFFISLAIILKWRRY